jgi:hypothetical protein
VFGSQATRICAAKAGVAIKKNVKRKIREQKNQDRENEDEGNGILGRIPFRSS